MRLAGLSYREIGKELGCGRQRAHQLLSPPKEIRQLIGKRAGWECESCGIHIDSGHVHHKECKWFEPDNYRDVANLMYLCIGCHTKAHTRKK